VLALALISTWYRVPAARPLVAIAGAYPLLYAAFPTASYWSDGRYAISLTPIVALVLVGGMWTAMSEEVVRWMAIAVLVLATASTLVAFNDGYGAIASPQKLTSWGTNPEAAVISLGDALLGHGVENVYAGYWVAYDLQFCSAGRISVMSVEADRDATEASSVQAASRAGWVFVGPSRADRTAAESQFGSTSHLDPDATSESGLKTWLNRHDVSFITFRAGPMEVVVPSRNVTPTQV
jgi:hypothetical protein